MFKREQPADSSEIVVNKILIVDDEENVLYTISAILEQEDYLVETAHSGEEAIEKLGSDNYDLLLTDLRMESASGLDVLKILQEISPSTVSIVLTGYASIETAITAMRRGAYDYLIKPCLIEDLKLTVRRGLEKRRLELIARRREQQLETINIELERIVEARTSELEFANQELKEKNQQIEQFVYLISHDLRSPIVSIQGLAGLLEDECQKKLSGGEGLNYISLIRKNAAQMGGLIDDLIEFIRMGEASLEQEDVDSDMLAREIWARFDSLNHGVKLEIKDKLPIVKADYNKLSQIFSNLFDNALKYQNRLKPPRVTLCSKEDESQWHFKVSDNGIGFEMRHREEIFKLFQRLKSSSDRPGSGIGLPIVRKLSQLHGGHAWAESRVGKGSVFHFTISKM